VFNEALLFTSIIKKSLTSNLPIPFAIAFQAQCTIGIFHKNKKLFVNHQTENEFDARVFLIPFSTWIISSIAIILFILLEIRLKEESGFHHPMWRIDAENQTLINHKCVCRH